MRSERVSPVVHRAAPVAARPARVVEAPRTEAREARPTDTLRDRLVATLASDGAAVSTRERVRAGSRAHAGSGHRESGHLAATRRPPARTTHAPCPRPRQPVGPAACRPATRSMTGVPHRTARARAPPRVLTKLHVTAPHDAWELHADAVAALVLSGTPAPAHASGPDLGGGSSDHPGAPATEAAEAAVQVLEESPGSGTRLPEALRRRIEPYVGADLSPVRVRQDASSAAAAGLLGARAFTIGSTIHLGPGSSLHDVGLLAHEATHVVQQGLAPARAPPVVMRSVGDYLPDISVTDVVPDWILDGVRSTVRAIPGYDALSYVVGEDLLTGEPVHVDTGALLEAVLTYGPFGPAVSTVLRGLDIVQGVFDAVSAQLAAHDLTLARMGRDIASAWDELSVTNGIDGNVAVVRRYVDAFLRDLGALVSDLVDQVLTLVREAVVAVAEPFLQRPEIAPVWNLAKEVLHYDPLRGVEVQVPTVQILSDFLTLIGETERLEQMRERGTLQETADWLDLQMITFLSIIADLGLLFSEAWAAIQPQNLPQLLDTLPALADRAIGVVRRIADFVVTLIAKVLELVKKALLGWLSEHAHRIPGFHLMTVIIGSNPFTGEDVPRTAVNLIRGFITLLPNGEATYEELAKSGVVTDAAARIEGAMARLGISLEMVVSTFRGVWERLSLDDLVQPVVAFERVVAQFGRAPGPHHRVRRRRAAGRRRADPAADELPHRAARPRGQQRDAGDRGHPARPRRLPRQRARRAQARLQQLLRPHRRLPARRSGRLALPRPGPARDPAAERPLAGLRPDAGAGGPRTQRRAPVDQARRAHRPGQGAAAPPGDRHHRRRVVVHRRCAARGSPGAVEVPVRPALEPLADAARRGAGLDHAYGRRAGRHQGV